MIDSHCHLNFHSLKNNFNQLISNSKKNNLTSILTINTDPKEFNDHLNLIKKYKSIYISYGLHPENVDNHTFFTKDNILLNCPSYSEIQRISRRILQIYQSNMSPDKRDARGLHPPGTCWTPL